MDGPSPLALQCLQALACSRLTRIQLCLDGCAGFTPAFAHALARSLPPSTVSFALRFSRVAPEGADGFLTALAAHMGSAADDAEAYSGHTPSLACLELVSDALTAEGGAAFGAVCGARAPPTLRAIDWGLPAPWAAGAAGREVAEALTSAREARPISHFGADRMRPCVCLPARGLTSIDLILLVASATAGCVGGGGGLATLDLSDNAIDSAGVAALGKAVAAGALRSLTSVDLSGNVHVSAAAKRALLGAMRTNETQKIKFTLSAERDLLIHPLDVAQLAPRPGGGA